jgi:hypothetical protein
LRGLVNCISMPFMLITGNMDKTYGHYKKTINHCQIEPKGHRLERARAPRRFKLIRFEN